MKLFKSLLIIPFFASSFLFVSCDSGINVFSKQDDVQLGAEVAAQIESDQQQFPIYRGDPSVKSYIEQRIFGNILSSSQVESKDIFPYQIELIDKPDELNAFALPGGYIYVYTGLLNYLDSEAALAGVLGHEIAHAELRHSTQRMTAQYGVSFLLSMILGENPGQIAEIASNLFVGLAFLKNSRDDEREADRESFSYLRDSRYYPGGVKFFFERMNADGLISGNAGQVELFLSTHPDPLQRIENTNILLQEAGLPVKDYNSEGTDIFRAEYEANVRSKLR